MSKTTTKPDRNHPGFGKTLDKPKPLLRRLADLIFSCHLLAMLQLDWVFRNPA
jgi:hypothetical protein